MSNLPGEPRWGEAGAGQGRGWAMGNGAVREGPCVRSWGALGSAASGAVSLADSKELDYTQLTVL